MSHSRHERQVKCRPFLGGELIRNSVKLPQAPAIIGCSYPVDLDNAATQVNDSLFAACQSPVLILALGLTLGHAELPVHTAYRSSSLPQIDGNMQLKTDNPLACAPFLAQERYLGPLLLHPNSTTPFHRLGIILKRQFPYRKARYHGVFPCSRNNQVSGRFR